MGVEGTGSLPAGLEPPEQPEDDQRKQYGHNPPGKAGSVDVLGADAR